MKRIAILNVSMVMGGTEKALINLLKILDYSKISVDLFLKSKSGELISQIPEWVSVFELPERIETSSSQIIKYYKKKHQLLSAFSLLQNKAILFFFRLFHFDRFEKNCYKNLMKKWGLYNLKKNNYLSSQYDIVVAFQGGDSDLQYYAGYVFNADKRIMWVHGDFGNQSNQLILDAFDKIICVSKALNKWFRETYPENEKKTSVIYNLIDVNEVLHKANEPVFDMRNSEVSIVSVGRLTEEKGFQLIPSIAKKLVDVGILFEWYIIGDGELFKQIETEISKLDLSCVHLLGEKINPYPYVKKCTLYVQPSFSEGYCIAVQEAKILCKPILVTNIPVMEEHFVHGQNGFITCGTTVDAIANGVKYLLSEKQQMNMLSKNLKSYYLECNNDIEAIQELLY